MFKRIVGAGGGAVLLAAVALIAPSAVFADGSTACSTNGSFYTVMGEETSGSSADNVSAVIDVQTLNRCNGADPDGKDGVFTYVELVRAYEADATGVQFAYDNSAHPSYYGAYLRFGEYICSWSGDTACGLGHGYFVSWSRLAGLDTCASSDASGIHRISAVSTGTHTFKIDIQSDGSVKFLLDGGLVYTLAASATGCWNRDGSVNASALGTAWDGGDQIGGSAAAHEAITGYSMNGGSGATTCSFTSINSYRCADTGSRDIAIWTIDR